jgi:hypothetical protein
VGQSHRFVDGRSSVAQTASKGSVHRLVTVFYYDNTSKSIPLVMDLVLERLELVKSIKGANNSKITSTLAAYTESLPTADFDLIEERYS